MALYLDASSLGDATAHYLLGACFRLGIGVPRDDTTSRAWLRRAAELGHAGAQLALGLRVAMADPARAADLFLEQFSAHADGEG